MDRLQTPSGTATAGFAAWKVGQILQTIEKTAGVSLALLDTSGVPASIDPAGRLLPVGETPVMPEESLKEILGDSRPFLYCDSTGRPSLSVPLRCGGHPIGLLTGTGFHLAALDDRHIEAIKRRLRVLCPAESLWTGRHAPALDFGGFSVLIDLVLAGAAQIGLVIASPSKGTGLQEPSAHFSPDLISALGELSAARKEGGRADDSAVRERLEAIYNSTQDAILMLDNKLKVVSTNRQFGHVFGGNSDAFIGVTGQALQRWIIKNAKDPVRVSTMIDELLANERAVLDDEVELLSPRYMILRFYSTPVVDRTGKNIGRLFVFRDITAFRKARRDLIGTEKANLISRVAAGMAHELNNILAGMVAYADYALEEGDSDKIREALKMSMSSADRASALVQKFLAVSGPSESLRQDVELHLELARLLNSMEPVFQRQNIRVHRQLEAVPRVSVDPVQVLQALRHVLDNAVEAVVKDGTISVKTETDWDRGNVRAIITDSGQGIPVEYLDRIFDPFFTTKGVVSGGGSTAAKGLGLSVAKGIIEAHGGKIYAGNVLPHGASLIVELPLAGTRMENSPPPSVY